MKLVVWTCVVLWMLVAGAILWATRKERHWLSDWKKVIPVDRRVTKALWLRWDRFVAHRGVRGFRRHIGKALKKGNKIKVDIDRGHLIELKNMSKHDLEKTCAMVTATLQMYEAMYGSALINAIVHEWPGEQRSSSKKVKL